MSIISEDKILSRINNKDLITYYKKFPKLSGLNIKFEILTDKRVRAENEYKKDSHEFIIRLGQKWKETDLAHELLHGKIMFIDKYGIINCSNPLCQLLRDYIEDIVIHRETSEKFDIRPFDERYITRTIGLAKDLFRGKKVIIDKYWDAKGLDCNQLHKALLYVQAWHFNHFLKITDFNKFLFAFRKVYQQRSEMELADKIVVICKNNNYLKNKLDYEKAATEIIEIYQSVLPNEKLIKHYKKSNSGFLLV